MSPSAELRLVARCLSGRSSAFSATESTLGLRRSS
jgi:hypothetical protein